MRVQGGVRSNPVAGLGFPPVDVKALNLAKTFKGHLMSVSSLAMHPTKPIVVCPPPLASHHEAPVMYVVVYLYAYGHTCLCVHVYVCLSVYVFVCLCICVSVCVYVCLSVYAYMHVCMYMHGGHIWTALWASKVRFYCDPT